MSSMYEQNKDYHESGNHIVLLFSVPACQAFLLDHRFLYRGRFVRPLAFCGDPRGLFFSRLSFPAPLPLGCRICRSQLYVFYPERDIFPLLQFHLFDGDHIDVLTAVHREGTGKIPSHRGRDRLRLRRYGAAASGGVVFYLDSVCVSRGLDTKKKSRQIPIPSYICRSQRLGNHYRRHCRLCAVRDRGSAHQNDPCRFAGCPAGLPFLRPLCITACFQTFKVCQFPAYDRLCATFSSACTFYRCNGGSTALPSAGIILDGGIGGIGMDLSLNIYLLFPWRRLY